MSQSLPALPRDPFAIGFLTLLQADPDDTATGTDPVRAAGEALFPGDVAKARSFVARFRALLEVLQRSEFERWTSSRTGDQFFVHPALVTAAAGTKLNKNARFPIRKLIDAATALEEVEFADWEWPTGDGGNEGA